MFGRRRVQRVTVNIPAWIEVGDSTLLERCTLVDLTDEGAKLVVGDISHLTDHFCLYLTRREQNPLGLKICIQFENAARSALRRWASELRGLLLF